MLDNKQKTESNMCEEIRDKACKYCRQFLRGRWLTVSRNQIEIKRISGGLSNLIFLIALPESVTTENGEPRQALLRIYGTILQSCVDSLLIDSVVFALLSERGLGPKLFGVFPGGRLEEYIPSRSLTRDELSQYDISNKITEKISSIHSLDMPLNREPRWLFAICDKWIKQIEKMSCDCDISSDDAERLSRLLSHDFRKEFSWMKSFLKSKKAAVVFCHNDLQEGNMLYSSEKDGGFDIVLIDFEYCSYNYRGFEFANHFCEWCYDYNVKESPYFTSDYSKYPTKERQLEFINAYIAASPVPIADDAETIYEEVNYFALSSHMLWTLWSIVQSESSKIDFGYLEYAETRLDHYFKHKSTLIEIPED